MAKTLYLSNTDKKIAGVCGGLAAYLGIDATIIRIIWFVLAFGYGTGLLLYLAFWLIVPRENTIGRL